MAPQTGWWFKVRENCPEHKLAIQIEGSVPDDVIRFDYDAERQACLASHDIRVLDFENAHCGNCRTMWWA